MVLVFPDFSDHGIYMSAKLKLLRREMGIGN